MHFLAIPKEQTVHEWIYCRRTAANFSLLYLGGLSVSAYQNCDSRKVTILILQFCPWAADEKRAAEGLCTGGVQFLGNTAYLHARKDMAHRPRRWPLTSYLKENKLSVARCCSDSSENKLICTMLHCTYSILVLALDFVHELNLRVSCRTDSPSVAAVVCNVLGTITKNLHAPWMSNTTELVCGGC